MPDGLRAGEKSQDFLGAENDRQFLGLLGSGNDLFEGPLFLEGDLVQEAKGGDGEADRMGGGLLWLTRNTWKARICSGPSASGDLWKCRANSETWRM